MTRLLRIDASSRKEGSHSRMLTDQFIAAWRAANPADTVVTRDLVSQPVPHIADETIKGFYTPDDQMTPALKAATALSDTLIAEVKAADVLVIGVPMYNFSIPSALKAWIDHIVRGGHTYAFDGSNFSGLLTGKKAYLLTAYGASGFQPEAGFRGANFLDPYLSFLLGFLGFSAVTTIPVEGLNIDPAAADRTRALATSQIAEIVKAAKAA